MIRAWMRDKFGLRDAALSTYYTEWKITVLLDAPKNFNLRKYLLKSKTMHGYIDPVPQLIYVHPDTVFPIAKRRARKSLRKLHIPE